MIEWVYLLVCGPELALGQPNNWLKNARKKYVKKK